MKQTKNPDYIGITVAILYILALIIILTQKVFPADFVKKGQIVPYSGILLTEEKAKMLLEEHYKFVNLEEKTNLQTDIIKAYQEKASETAIYITKIQKERDQYKNLFEAKEKSSRWNWIKNVIYFTAGMGIGWLVEKIIE